jgi:ACS family glucarate transporter-like MFS transporter
VAELRDDGPATAIRWRIVGLLAAFSLVSYALRTNVSIAAPFLRSELHLSHIQLGQVFSAFMIGYAIFQIPSGALSDRYGPRLVLTVAAAIWGLTTFMTGALPGLVGGAAATLAVLLTVRFLLGLAEAATYPVAASAIGVWMPASERAFSNSLVIAGMALGSAFIPPLMSRLMVASGWRTSFYVTSVPGFLIAALWWWYARDDPAQHPGVNEGERRAIAAGRAPASTDTGAAAEPRRRVIHWRLLRNRNMLLISASYFLDSYVLFIFVFWFYLYLVDERQFSILRGGVYSSLPWIAALIVVPVGGRACDVLSSRRGPRIGRRVVAMTGLVVSSALLVWGARTDDAMLAIAALSLSVAFLMSTEGPFWSSAIDISGAHAGTAGGIMNTAGNLGGVVSTSLVPMLVERFGWAIALATGSAFGVVSALLWLFIRVDQTDRRSGETALEGGT